MAKRKSILLWLWAALCFICALFSCAFLGGVQTASAASSFELMGASVRTSQMDGIRFIATIDEGEFASYGDARYGIILIPEDMDNGSALTVTFDGEKYTPSNADAIVIEGGELWSDELCAQYEIASGKAAFSCALIADQGEGEEAVRFPEEFYNRALTAVGFIIPENGATIYTQKLTRSMAYVALVESLKPGYEGNTFIEDIIDDVSVDFSVAGGKIDNTKTSYAPDLKLGGLDALDSSLVGVVYTSSNASVAKVVSGKVQAVADGEVTITATVSVGGTAKFTATTTVTVDILKATVTATATTGGTATGGGTFEQGTSVALTAKADTGYTFDGWYVNGSKVSSSTTYTFTATKNVSVEARYKVNTYTVSLTAGTGGSVTGAGTYDYNSTATIKATPNTGYSFVKWSDGNTSATRTLTITKAVSLSAEFKINTYKFTITAGTGGSVSGAGTYDYNTSVTIT